MSHIHRLNLPKLQAKLQSAGLNLCSVFSAKTLRDTALNLPECDNLILIGNAGPALWQSIPAHFFDRAHPVDDYTVSCVSELLSDQIPESCWRVLYPFNSELNIPLQGLGALAGWHHPSPLGIGINQRHGLWFAYRAVVAVDAEYIIDTESQQEPLSDQNESPCLTCRDTPCLEACPADALELSTSPNLRACVSHRCEEESSCASTCLARQACPVAPEFRYKDEQIHYYYDRSLLSAKRWIAE